MTLKNGQKLSRLPGHHDPDNRSRYWVRCTVPAPAIVVTYQRSSGDIEVLALSDIAIITSLFDGDLYLHGRDFENQDLRNCHEHGVMRISDTLVGQLPFIQIVPWLRHYNRAVAAALLADRPERETPGA